MADFQFALQTVLSVSCCASVIVLCSIAIQGLVGSKWSPRVTMVLWTLVLLRFVMFATPESPTSVFNWFQQNAAAAKTTLTDYEPLPGTASPHLSAAEWGSIQTTPRFEPADQKVVSASPINWWNWALNLWLVGAAFTLLALTHSRYRIWQLTRRSEPPSKRLERLFATASSNVCRWRNAQLRLTDDIDVPATSGVLRPIVFLPGWCAGALNDRQIELIFAHEMVHLRRFDNLRQIISQMILAIHWFNPLVRVAIGRLRDCSEITCDQTVLALYSKDGLNWHRLYGETILLVASRANHQPAPPLLMGTFIGKQTNLIRQRIETMVQQKSNSLLNTFIAAMCIGTLLAVGFTSAQTMDSTADVPMPHADGSIGPPTYASPAFAADFKQPDFSSPVNVEPGKSYGVVVGEVRRFRFDEAIPELLVSDPDVVKATPVSPNEILIEAIEPGVSVLTCVNQNRDTLPISVFTMNKQDISNPRIMSLITDQAEAAREIAIPISPATGEQLQLNAGVNRKLQFDFPIPKVFVSKPEHVEVTPISPDELLITAIKPVESCAISIPNICEFEVQVLPNSTKLELELHERFPELIIQVLRRGTELELSGVVSSQEERNAVVALAKRFSDKVVDQLTTIPLSTETGIRLNVIELDMSTFADKQQILANAVKTEPELKAVATLIADSLDGKIRPITIVSSATSTMDKLFKELSSGNVSMPVLVTKENRPGVFFEGEEIPKVNVNGEVEFQRVGNYLEVTPRHLDESKLAVFLATEFTKVDQRQKRKFGASGIRFRGVQAVTELGFGESAVMAVTLPTGEYDSDHEGDETPLLLISATPKKLPMTASGKPLKKKR